MMIAMETPYSSYVDIPIGSYSTYDRWIKKIDGNPIEVEVLDYDAYINGIQLPHAILRPAQVSRSTWEIVDNVRRIYATVTVLCDTDVVDEDFFQYMVYGMYPDDPKLEYVTVVRVLPPHKDHYFL